MRIRANAETANTVVLFNSATSVSDIRSKKLYPRTNTPVKIVTVMIMDTTCHYISFLLGISMIEKYLL